jgi:hypothetical protein
MIKIYILLQLWIYFKLFFFGYIFFKIEFSLVLTLKFGQFYKVFFDVLITLKYPDKLFLNNKVKIIPTIRNYYNFFSVNTFRNSIKKNNQYCVNI